MFLLNALILSIHAPTRGATSHDYFLSVNYNFQSTLLQEERLETIELYLPYIAFNPRSYKRSDVGKWDYDKIRTHFQSTLLQEERQWLTDYVFRLFTLSIHAPTRGATTKPYFSLFLRFLSIHAPTRGATQWLTLLFGTKYFQSTLLQEERHSRCCGWYGNLKLSIHAPTRGATNRSCRNKLDFVLSIHAPTRGATSFIKLFFDLGGFFQSTLLQEERLYGYFSSIKDEVLSIHAPTRGATKEGEEMNVYEIHFQSTLLQEERLSWIPP